MTSPLISVIIPVYNNEKYIKDALDSVFKQNYSNLEVIVINDGSNDNSLEIIKNYNQELKVISQDNQGPSVARNKGIKEAKGEIFAFIDADDLWSDNHIDLMLPHLLEDSIYHIIRGQTQVIKMLDNKVTEVSDKIKLQLLGSSLYRSSIFEIVGLFNESMRQGEDMDWIMRFSSGYCKEKMIEETTLYYRRHQTNMTNDIQVIRKGIFESLRNKIKRDDKIVKKI